MRYVGPLATLRPGARICAFALLSVVMLCVTGPASSRSLDATHILAITYTSNATWTLAGSPYVIDGNVQVAAGATLTIEPGVVVKFNGTLRWLRVTGTIKAIGTGADPITFTSIQDDSIAGDTGGDGETVGAPGQWYAVEIVAGTQSEFRNVDVQYGGYGSAEWGYGAITVNNQGTSVLIDRSDIHDNQTSGVKLYLGGASISHSTIANNANGISANMAWVALTDRTVVSDNSKDGVWFNYTNTYSGPTSSFLDSDVIGNGRYGLEIGVDRTLPTSYWPHGNRNNIYDNASKQLHLSGYHPASTPQYNVDWTGNYWGSDATYWNAPGGCSTTSPNSPGHVAYQSSTANPPDGPISSSNYSAGTQLCAYDRFLISASGFNTGYTQAEPQLTPQQHATVVSIAEDDPRVEELLAGHSYTASEVIPWSRVQTDLLLGAEITFSWSDPVSVSYDWPGIYYDYNEYTNPPYTEGNLDYAVSNMKTLVVLVDLTRGLVVSIQPGLEAVAEPPPPLLHQHMRSQPDARPTRQLQSLSMVAEDQGGYRTNRMQIVCLGGSCFRNYDFTKKAKRGIRADRVDWPVTMIFWNSATINRVKDAMCTFAGTYFGMNYCETGSPMYASIKDVGATKFAWDEDKGRKTIKCPGPGLKTPHIRLYADSDDQLGFNPTYGYFVIATTHFDHNECAGIPGTDWRIGYWSGHSEDAEERIENDLGSDYGLEDWVFAADSVNLYNAENGRMEGSHRKQNNGYATAIKMPTP